MTALAPSPPTPLPQAGEGGSGSIASARDLIASSGIDASEARSLLAFVLDATREALIARPQRAVEPDAMAHFGDLCARRARGEPVAYLLGQREFFGRLFRVDRSVLIPRPETESLVDAALRQLQGVPAPRVLDLGTGSGCIAITLALERPDAQVWATDISQPALEVARGNAAALSARVSFLCGRWFAPLRGRFELIVANPPYVAEGDPHLAELLCEPREALTDGADGLSCLVQIMSDAPKYLARGGALLVEHGYDQGAAVREFMGRSGFHSIRTLPDLAGIERVCVGRID